MESWSYKDEDALYAESQPPTLPILLAAGDSLLITRMTQEKFAVSHASTATAGESASGTAVTSRFSDGFSLTLTIPRLDSTFEGFVLSRLMDGESDGSGLSR